MLVVGSPIGPLTIQIRTSRAHAFEGQLFRLAVEEILEAHGIRTDVLLERDAYFNVAA
jgi:hypothetical protein